jgi:hypothetical protein
MEPTRIGAGPCFGRASKILSRSTAECRLPNNGVISHLLTASGRFDEAIEETARACDEREGTVPLLNTDPGKDRFRGDPRYEALAGRLGLPVCAIPQSE